MKTHTLIFRQVDRNGFNNIRTGRKTVETRAATVKYRDIKSGDQLIIKCGDDSVTRTAGDVRHFAGIDELLAEVPMNSVMPDAKSRQDVEREYFSYPGYRQKIADHGLIALFLDEDQLQ